MLIAFCTVQGLGFKRLRVWGCVQNSSVTRWFREASTFGGSVGRFMRVTRAQEDGQASYDSCGSGFWPGVFGSFFFLNRAAVR